MNDWISLQVIFYISPCLVKAGDKLNIKLKGTICRWSKQASTSYFTLQTNREQQKVGVSTFILRNKEMPTSLFTSVSLSNTHLWSQALGKNEFLP